MDNEAVPPSSPPHAIATNPPSSPFFEPQRYGAFSPKSSSPPPLFSSDDSGETLDITNYESPRIFKNKRKGAWYDNAESTPEPKKTKMSRNYDSGVYMMSDNSDGSVDPLPEHKSPFPFGMDGAQDEPEREQMSVTEAQFYSALRVGLDRNSEKYDFQRLNLEDSDIKQIGDLNSVIKNLPDPGNDLPAEGQYRSMLPELYINLSHNFLHRLTPILFQLQHLTTLVLRDNQIEELPPQISQLHSLKELDLSLNKLTYLPFEILQMLHPHGRLERLQTIGNPLLERMSPLRIRRLGNLSATPPKTEDLYAMLPSCNDREALVWYIRNIETMESNVGPIEATFGNPRKRNPDEKIFPHHPTFPPDYIPIKPKPTLRYIARTPVSFFDQTGQLLRGSPSLPTSTTDPYDIIVETESGAFSTSSSPPFLPPDFSKKTSLHTRSLHTRSLLTQSLTTALTHLTPHSTLSLIGSPVPPAAASILACAIHNDADAGFGYWHECHVCGKRYIVARAEWIEFWSQNFTLTYPIKVKVCSWGCVPEGMVGGRGEVLRW